MRQKRKGSPRKDELKGIDFTPTMKSKADVSIWESQDDFKKGVESAFTLFGKMMSESLSLIARLQREARGERDE